MERIACVLSPTSGGKKYVSNLRNAPIYSRDFCRNELRRGHAIYIYDIPELSSLSPSEIGDFFAVASFLVYEKNRVRTSATFSRSRGALNNSPH